MECPYSSGTGLKCDPSVSLSQICESGWRFQPTTSLFISEPFEEGGNYLTRCRAICFDGSESDSVLLPPSFNRDHYSPPVLGDGALEFTVEVGLEDLEDKCLRLIDRKPGPGRLQPLYEVSAHRPQLRVRLPQLPLQFLLLILGETVLRAALSIVLLGFDGLELLVQTRRFALHLCDVVQLFGLKASV